MKGKESLRGGHNALLAGFVATHFHINKKGNVEKKTEEKREIHRTPHTHT